MKKGKKISVKGIKKNAQKLLKKHSDLGEKSPYRDSYIALIKQFYSEVTLGLANAGKKDFKNLYRNLLSLKRLVDSYSRVEMCH